jgi:hypothetical protein
MSSERKLDASESILSIVVTRKVQQDAPLFWQATSVDTIWLEEKLEEHQPEKRKRIN